MLPRAVPRALLMAVLMAVLMSCDPERPPSPSSTVVEPASTPVPAPLAPETEPDTAGRPMLIVFSRDYCTPCRVMKPWVAELASETPSVDIVSVNVDRQEHEHLGRFFHITAVPLLAFIDADGQVRARREGLASKREMTTMLRRFGWHE